MKTRPFTKQSLATVLIIEGTIRIWEIKLCVKIMIMIVRCNEIKQTIATGRRRRESMTIIIRGSFSRVNFACGVGNNKLFAVEPFSKKLIVMDSFMSHKTVIITVFIDRCARNFFLYRRVCVFPQWTFLFPQAWNNKSVFSWGRPCDVMALELNCILKVSEFKLQSRYYIHFRTATHGKGIEPHYSPFYGLNSITIVLLQRGLSIK